MLKSFGNLWGHLYKEFVTLDINFRFLFGKPDLYENILKFQNIMTKIVGILYCQFLYIDSIASIKLIRLTFLEQDSKPHSP